MFIPITKVDAVQRLVYGLATAEVEDRAGEICDYASTRPLYEKWSEEIAKSSGGKSLGNLRAMHGPVAAGKVTHIHFNDADKQIEICAKVIDDAEWAKVAEGVYTGFSQGGAYVRRWTDENGLTRYTADPREISLVDLPCLPQARFEMIKADGTRELRRFGKGLDALVQLTSLAEELEDLQKEIVSEESDRDGSSAPRKLRDLVASVSVILRALTNQQAVEPFQSDTDPSKPMAMSASSRKSAVRSGAALSKIGARDREANQNCGESVYNASVELGAECDGPKSSSGGLEKRFDRLAATLADVLQRVKQIEAQPLPLPFAGPARVVGKHEDAASNKWSGETTEKLLQDPEALSLLAIKLAQRNGRAPFR
jgi:hypothetical protein